MAVLAALFWFSLFLLVYAYVGYPLLVYVFGNVRPRQVAKSDCQPHVSVVIAAHNEASNITQTIENKLSLNYPSSKLEIIIVSDGSTDGTDEIVKGIVQQWPDQVRLLRQDPRAGKTAALNIAITESTGDIIVFADANSLYKADALSALMRNFSDPSVGYVTGHMIYLNPDGSLIGDGCTAFMRYENFLRQHETELGSVVGVDGGIDAVRKNLYTPMRTDQLPDFVLPLAIIRQGYRVVFERSAILQEQALTRRKEEYQMRVRVALRAFWAIHDMKDLLNPLRYGLYSWQLWSHKVLRYTAFVPLLLVAVLNVVLSIRNTLYQPILFAQAFFYLSAALGSGLERTRLSLFGWPYYFVLINMASAHAVLKFLKGEKRVVWEPRTG
jgi:cellulose synthase/poly-beta-1,6-N-acetylglucosamine synthase-like glycosyltransferase